MIRKIEIENFKSVKKLEFEPGRVTVLIGENGAGKSNILEMLEMKVSVKLGAPRTRLIGHFRTSHRRECLAVGEQRMGSGQNYGSVSARVKSSLAVLAMTSFLSAGCHRSADEIAATAADSTRATAAAASASSGSTKPAATSGGTSAPAPRSVLDGEQSSATVAEPPPPPVPKPILSPKEIPAIPVPAQLLAATPSGNGVIVCEPVPATRTDSATAAFAAGCGDYLEVHVGGEPMLGQTPLLTSIGRARRELKLPSGLRLSLADAKRVAEVTGANKVAIGTVSSGKTPGELEIDYSLYNAATGKASGQSLSIHGTSEQILTALPSLAGEMARQFGATSPQAMPAAALTVSEMQALGGVFWTDNYTAEDAKTLNAAAARDATAMICTLSQERYSDTAKFTADARLLLTKLAPRNPLAWAHAAYMNALCIIPLRAELAPLRQSYPDNYALAHTDVWLNRAGGDPKDEQIAAEAAVQNAPRNPDAWMSLGWTLSSEAAAVRRGRFYAAMPAEDSSTINQIYGVWEFCEQKATEIDPQHEVAWSRLVTAATFSGERQVAADAYWKAETYSRDKAATFDIGLDMFQPKWGGNPLDLEKVAEHAAAADYPLPETAGQIANTLRLVGFSDRANALIGRYMTPVDARIKANPNDANAHWDKASLLWNMQDIHQCAKEYKQVTLLLPNSAKAHYDYAVALDECGAKNLAIAEYEAVLRLDPSHTYAPVKLGLDLKHDGQIEDAAKYLQIGIERDPNSLLGHFGLGEMALRQKKYAEAAREFRRCLDLDGPDPITYAYLTDALAGGGDNKAAIHWGEEGLSMFGDIDRLRGDYHGKVSQLHSALAYAYLKAKRYPDAESANKEAIEIDPSNTSAIVNQGYVYNETGRRADARQQWLSAEKMSLDPETADEVHHDLVTYPDAPTTH